MMLDIKTVIKGSNVYRNKEDESELYTRDILHISITALEAQLNKSWFFIDT